MKKLNGFLRALRASVVIISILILVAVCPAVRADPISAGDVTIDFTPGAGMKIDLAHVPISRGSTVQLFSPGWKRGYFSSIGSRPQIASDPALKQFQVTYHAEKSVQFDATEVVRLVDDHRIEITLDGTLQSNVSAKLEWTLGYINAFALYGGGYNDTKVTVKPPSGNDKTVVHGASAITLNSPVGKAVITMEQGGGRMALLDGRLDANSWWEEDRPSFWLGCLGEDVPVGKPFHYVVSIDFTPAAWPTTAPAHDVAIKSDPVSDALVPRSTTIQIIPKPKKMQLGQGVFPLAKMMDLHADSDPSGIGAAAIQREVKRRFDWDWKIGNSQADISLENDSSLKPEQYRIDCTAKSLRITASDARGFFNAAQTLAQLITIKNGDVCIPTCSIDDWPTLSFRGVHLFPGKGALDLHRNLIERIFARYKFNYLVLECQFTQWQTDPKIWVGDSIPKDDLRQYVQTVRDNQIEPIPLIESLGHVGWMFSNGQNLDLAEDPKAAWAYDATNPKSYEFIEKVYDEAIDIFHPKYFHIGHDEVGDRGVYPSRDASKKIGLPKLFTSDTQKLCDYLAAKKIRPMLWGDMLLTKNESNDGGANAPDAAAAKQMRSEIPKDAIICDWHYTPAKPEDYKSLKIFKDAGFTDTIACPWFNPRNIYTIADAAKQDQSWGLLQTTWAGYRIDEAALQRDFKQFSAYILAAEYAWNAGEAPSPDNLGYRPEEVFAQSMYPRPQSTDTRPGRLLDLADAASSPLVADQIDLGGMPLDQSWDGVRFKLADRRGIALGGALIGAQPRSCTLRVDQSANQIAFLQGTIFPTSAGEEVGAYEVHFADGSTSRISLSYGLNIRAFDDPSPTIDASAAWTGKSSSGQPATVRLFVWQNPHPQTPIKSITFMTNHSFASPTLLGVTIVN